ncbi:shikimate kinase [Microvirga sp. W0021]|uniref:Shikimate kinase n=1 Tax=Hohaiivirga grylli TaxID=3133970 RepID=A0ABV0BKY3_9HYPH
MKQKRKISPVSARRSLRMRQVFNRRAERLRNQLGRRSIVLVGLMGAGKSTVGRRLAMRLGLPFLDADHEIETAAGMSIPDIFEIHGEDYFREGERRVIARILQEGPLVLATGGGAYMNEETRKAVSEKGVAVWLKADVDVLLERVSRRNNRPLLKQSDPKTILEKLTSERNPFYAMADVHIESREGPHDRVVSAIVRSLRHYLDKQEKPQS